LAKLRVRAFIGDIAGPVAAALPTQVPSLIIAPDSGYYPMGADIAVTSTNGFPDGTLLYYTTDGSNPTTNSIAITHDSKQGILSWRDGLHDLRSLKIRAFLGPNQGEITAGKPVSFPGEPEIQGEIGIPPARNGYKAGIGSFYILPIIANLRDNQQLESLLFNVEISAMPGAPHLEKGDVQVLPMSTNDFIQVLPGGPLPPANPISFARNGTNTLQIGYVGPDSGLKVTAGDAPLAVLGIQFLAEDKIGEQANLGDRF